ncbi:serine/threonine-protein kinase bur-1 [Histoplasma capsulatum G186AR]|uniref:Serine/threonine-protein kinase BUR1 n=2 Tax=Ajellomyces capsulatus TaxID=5037 RepID=C0NE89_AJECG|nr:serine/threonine-protein kinase bur-1 [Histoplasma capsulatum G186AR]EEH10537.1 serine/threonine-protein kinase bur-1 [Histoplasma capsulatum G186AR]KAG5290475.1 serine/threonine-protein kinase bur-1 [Histoplasma capsulatum]QSS72403.1 serine/threonine-protein kinase bur-1 [Histoplasma capsulatum G186AR]
MVIPNSSPQSKVPLERDEHGNPRFHGCSNIREFEFLGKLGEGTFGEVYKARSKRSGAIVALKKILMHNEKDGFPITALREIKLLKMLSHPNVLQLQEMAVERPRGEGRKKPSMYMVTPYMDHDLSGLLENPSVHFTEPQIKCYMLQLLEGLRYLHENKILHRDMKAANLLINNKGILQIADFGLARPYDESPPKPGKGGGEAVREYTTLVVTRWYRPPELLLHLRKYTTAIDMWGVGCVFGEMFKGKPILAGSSDINQAHLIFSLVGTPTEENMPGWSSLPGCDVVKNFGSMQGNLATVFKEQGAGVISLLSELLKLDWRKRINAIDALQHPYFRSPPFPARPGDLPKFEDSHELDRRKFRGQKAALPPAPAGGSVGMGPNGEWTSGSGLRQNSDQKLSRIPNVARGPPTNGASVAPRRQFDNRVPDVAQPQRKLASDEPRGHLPAWQRDSTLPPKPPVSSYHPWTAGQAWRGDSRLEPRRDGPPPRRESGLDSYIPNYDGPADRFKGRDDGRRDTAELRDYDRDRSRRRSRSPEPRHRTRSRESNSYYDLHRR